MNFKLLIKRELELLLSCVIIFILCLLVSLIFHDSVKDALGFSAIFSSGCFIIFNILLFFFPEYWKKIVHLYL